MNDDVKALVEQLEAWAPLVSSGYEVPAAGQTMMNASRALTAQAEEIERLREMLAPTQDNIVALGRAIYAQWPITVISEESRKYFGREIGDAIPLDELLSHPGSWVSCFNDAYRALNGLAALKAAQEVGHG